MATQFLIVTILRIGSGTHQNQSRHLFLVIQLTRQRDAISNSPFRSVMGEQKKQRSGRQQTEAQTQSIPSRNPKGEINEELETGPERSFHWTRQKF